MDLDFNAETPEGLVEFKGKLTKDEVSFLLRFALLSLIARGTLPILQSPEFEEVTPEKMKMN